MKLALAGVLVAAPAFAQEQGGAQPRFCPNRPSLGASGCTTLPGQVQVEVSGVDHERAHDDASRTDTILYGDWLARFGVSRRSELQIGWTPYGVSRLRDGAGGVVSQVTGVGDMTLAWRRAISHPDGKKLSSAVQPFVTLPTGRDRIGDGDWSAGMTVPVYYQITPRWSIDFTGAAAARADQGGGGHHFDASGVFGLGYSMSDAVTATAEFSVERDDDPSGRVTRTLAAGSVAWQPTARTQIDVLAVAGLDHDAPDIRLVLGGAVLF